MATIPDTTVVHGVYTQPGAPKFAANTEGNLVAVLKGLLVDGWYESEPLSVEYDAATEEAVITFPLQHYYTRGQVIEVSGLTPEAYNGRWKIASTTGFTLRYKLPSDPGGAGSGASKLVKCAPAGWELAIENETQDIAIFTNSVGKSFQVWNDEAKSSSSTKYSHASTTATIYQGCKIRAVQNFTDTTNGEEYCGAYFQPICDARDERQYGTGDTVPYEFVADDQGIHFIWRHHNLGWRSVFSHLYFGMNAHSDHGARVFMASGVNNSYSGDHWDTYHLSNIGHMGGGYDHQRRLEFTDVGTNRQVAFRAGYGTSAAGRGPFAYPMPSGDMLMVSRVPLFCDGATHGVIPGMGFPLHDRPLSNHTKFTDGDGREWWTLELAKPGETYEQGSGDVCQLFFDITGPWR